MTTRSSDSQWLNDLGEIDADLAAEALLFGLTEIAPSASSRNRLLEATSTGRLHRFAQALSSLLDVTVDRARALLDRAMDPSGWESGLLPGLSTLWVEGGATVAGCIRGFIRLEAGHTFPVHHHLGDEQVLVLEGVMVDSDGTAYHPGEYLPKTTGSEHGYHAQAGGPDLLTFAVVREGITIGEMVVRHPD